MAALVIVESPTKAKTISKFLPKGYKVVSSMGHVRDLPSSAKEIPAKYKKEKWANLGVNVAEGFEPLYVIPDKKKKLVKELTQLVKEYDELILATDEDREGEAISWHLLQLLKPKVPVKRMVFHEITKEAIEEALKNFRTVDDNLVYAQETRRIIDRLAGYTISPVLWQKIAPKLSAGRVQSVAVALLVERERDRMRFKSAGYWDLLARLTKDGTDFSAELISVDEQKVATGSDFDKETGKLKKTSKALVVDQAHAEKLKSWVDGSTFRVVDLEVQEQLKHPAPPFITSTLQQEGGRKLRMSAKETMSVAQKLYEKGYITYMRTDSVNLSQQAIQAARNCVTSRYGKEFLSESPRQYKTKAKGAQEAHEAIRPAGNKFVDPDKTDLVGKERELYELIWKRTIATQMAPARLQFTHVYLQPEISEADLMFQAKGKQILFPGYYKAYMEGRDDGAADDDEAFLPNLAKKDQAACKEVKVQPHETKPPARFTEASLIKILESEGVGRPSTYASIISTIQDRGYVRKVDNALVPTFIAMAVVQLLEKYFPDLVNTGFTAEMEEHLDEIAEGKRKWQGYLEDYYSGKKGIKPLVESVSGKIDGSAARVLTLPVEFPGVQVCVGRYGPYIKGDKEEARASIPEDFAPADLTLEFLTELWEKGAKSEDEPIGVDPETGKSVYVKIGRFGPYVQLGEVTEDDPKPKRGSLLKGMTLSDIDLKTALELLSLPRLLGVHPETGQEVRAGVGRFGPFIVHDGKFRSLTAADNVLTVNLERGLELLSQEKGAGRGRGKAGATKEPLANLGKLKGGKTEIQILDGRYGPYIKAGKLNVAIPKGREWQSVTFEEAVEWIDAKK